VLSWRPNEISLPYVGPRSTDRLGRGRRLIAANLLRPLSQALRRQVSKVVGKGAEDGALRRRPTHPESGAAPRDLKMARDG